MVNAVGLQSAGTGLPSQCGKDRYSDSAYYESILESTILEVNGANTIALNRIASSHDLPMAVTRTRPMANPATKFRPTPGKIRFTRAEAIFMMKAHTLTSILMGRAVGGLVDVAATS